MRARSGLRVHRGLRHGEGFRGARHCQTTGRSASSISLQRHQLQPDLEHGWRHQRILRGLRSDREWRAPRGAAAGGAGGIFGRWRYLRGVQHFGRRRDPLRHPRREGPHSQLPHDSLSWPCGDHARAPQRSAPARSPECVERHLGARGTDDPAGCGDHLCHRQRPQERPSRSADLREQDLQPRCGRPDIERHSNHDGRCDLYGPRSACDRPASTERVHPSGGHTAESFLRKPFRRRLCQPGNECSTSTLRRLRTIMDAALVQPTSVRDEALGILSRLGVPQSAFARQGVLASSPITGELIAYVRITSPDEVSAVTGRATEAFNAWRKVPAPRRGEFVRVLAEELRANKDDLGRLVTLETGKIVSEGLGEVQEMIDICDFAVGLSRQLYGRTIATERADHRMMETWHPLGVCGVISAFNFPVAVWSWNAALALVCGDPVVWKPSEKTPLTTLATQTVVKRAAARFDGAPKGLSKVIIGGRGVGELMVDHPRVQLVSATGSTAMGRQVGPRLAARFARSLLELGGNNAAIVAPSADLDLALRGIAFAAMGTAGQRCTTLRRLFVHESVYDALVPRLKSAYASVRVGDPREAGTLVGPLIDEGAVTRMQRALDAAKAAGGAVSGGERIGSPGAGAYVRPALVEMPKQADIVREETFAPILYVMRYKEFEDAVRLQNDVPQGLSSSVFTNDMREAERFTSAEGSDCGIANVNIGPSGAEIGGAFGGEKETGGGREAGSDSWKAYMRRATNTINFGTQLPLAQGVRFDIEG